MKEHLVEFQYMSLQEVFSCGIKFVGHGFWVRDADSVDVWEAIVPDGPRDATATYHDADSVAQLLPDHVKVYTSRLQRHCWRRHVLSK